MNRVHVPEQAFASASEKLQVEVAEPESVDASQNKTSVLAPPGAALPGARADGSIIRRMTIEAVLYRPEAGGSLSAVVARYVVPAP